LVQHLLQQIPASKLILGLANYARGVTLADRRCIQPGCPHTGQSKADACAREPGVGFAEGFKKNQKWTVDPVGGFQYTVVNGNQWFSMEGPKTLAMKATMAREQCLSGFMVWSMDTDAGLVTGFFKKGMHNGKAPPTPTLPEHPPTGPLAPLKPPTKPLAPLKPSTVPGKSPAQQTSYAGFNSKLPSGEQSWENAVQSDDGFQFDVAEETSNMRRAEIASASPTQRSGPATKPTKKRQGFNVPSQDAEAKYVLPTMGLGKKESISGALSKQEGIPGTWDGTKSISGPSSMKGTSSTGAPSVVLSSPTKVSSPSSLEISKLLTASNEHAVAAHSPSATNAETQARTTQLLGALWVGFVVALVQRL
jgi:hypothetical protein